ncbi:flavodoxin family protein [Helicovermis profundi]|uniref:NADPH-dependent FMN reductase-like domain-containing protein n=1 Tax=Helicovermis profundi TaxID=3065157 RepID=A0AAU9E6R8_9FIRM|nr:hypothetical protein HLPR_21510 [Clostridia bacterium S502]
MSEVKNILVISASPRKKGDGYKITESIIKEIGDEKSFKWEYLFLNDFEIKACIGCRICIKMNEEKCPFKDDLLSIVSKMNDADGYVFTSPVYSVAVSSQMKAFIDRTNYLLHRPFSIGKPTIAICTAELRGTKSVIKYLSHILNTLGLRYEGGIGVKIGPYKNNKKYKRKTDIKIKKLAGVFKTSLEKGNRQKPYFKQAILFKMWQTRAIISKDKNPYDYEYWLAKGWINTDYYYPTKINSISKFLFKLFKKRLAKFMKEGFIYK